MSLRRRARAHASPVGAIAAWCVAALVLLGAAPPGPVFTDVGAAVGLPGLHDSTITPTWFDLDEDGNPDPIWLSYEGSVTLNTDASGDALEPIDLPASLEDAGGPPLLGAVLDADGDGSPELLALGRELALLGRVGPRKFGTRPAVLPTLPAAFVTDIAVGDLNADGLSDLVIALSLYALERIDLSGPPNVVLMNLGEGRFELHRVEPAREAFSNGVSLADLDGDGRLDLVESVDTSSLSGLGRALLNRTPPGARTPVFEVMESDWDIGTFGMGADIADVNQDGQLDIFNTSVGFDLLTFGDPQGGFTDVTLERGITHQWGQENIRTQWSPTLLDLNADGRLDILVRQGHEGPGLNGLLPVATDLLYVQDAEGHFHRAAPPFDPLAPSMGRHAVPGDRNGDGLPDVALGGLEGSAGYWRNDTPVEAGSRAITVRFQTSVSAWPPTGAMVVGTCGALTWTRHLTSGGWMGGSAMPEVYAAWPACAEDPSLEVLWPSGARSVHVPPPGATTLVVEEPGWWSRDGGEVTLDPRDSGASQACLSGSSGQLGCCSAGQAPCVLSLEGVEGAPRVALDDRAPMALYPEPGWAIHAAPSPPRPGADVTLRLMHVGAPESYDPESTSVWVDETFSYPEGGLYDEQLRLITVVAPVPESAPQLEVTFYPLNLLPEVTWSLSTGLGVDSDWAYQSVYPYRIEGGVTEFWNVAVYTTLIRGVLAGELIEPLALERPDGVEVPVTRQLLEGNVGRARLLAEADDLLGLDQVVFRDRGASFTRLVSLPPPLTLEEATDVLDHVAGGVSEIRAVGDGELLLFAISLRDSEGTLLPPEPELVELEVDGARVTSPLFINGATYNLTTALPTEPGAGPGEVRVRATDGRLLGAFPFERIAADPQGLSLALSSASLHALEGSGPDGATHRVAVEARDVWGDRLGANLHSELLVSGGEVMGSPALDVSGILNYELMADPTASLLAVTVIVEGEQLVVLETALEPTQTFDGDLGVDAGGEADGASTESSAVTSTTSGPGRSGCGGCAGGGEAPWSMSLLWLLGLALRVREARS